MDRELSVKVEHNPFLVTMHANKAVCPCSALAVLFQSLNKHVDVSRPAFLRTLQKLDFRLENGLQPTNFFLGG